MKKKIIIGFLFVALIAAGFTTRYVFFSPHRNPAAEKAAYTLKAEDFSSAFKAGTANATGTYINKAVLLEGKITNIEGVTVTLNNIACNIDSTEAGKISSHKIGDDIKIQGLVVGYNDLLEEINLAQCAFK